MRLRHSPTPLGGRFCAQTQERGGRRATSVQSTVIVVQNLVEALKRLVPLP
jgi:hypothetical protein